jgi:plastocyanin
MKKLTALLIFTFAAFNILNAQTKHVVEASNFAFDPADITIAVGDTVEWVWVNGMHTTTSEVTTGPDVWDALLDASNTSFSIVITTEGEHPYHCTPHLTLGMVGTINATIPNAVNDEDNNPNKFQLSQNYPNPFNPSTKIRFSIPEESQVSIKIFNALGQDVSTILNNIVKSGTHSVDFDASELTSGIYFYKITAGKLTDTKKMLLLK